jgi:serine/threonine protein kinase
MRAPEVFLGHAYTEISQVWAIAATLLCWIKPGTLGVWDSPHYLINEAWSVAKIKRLFPHWLIPTPDEVEVDELKITVEHAVNMSKEVPELLDILPLKLLMQAIEMPQELRNLLCLMMVVDPSARPSASSVLTSRDFRLFKEHVSV